MTNISAAITAVGGYVPDYVLTNQILETMVDTNDDWITSRTGIKERRILKGDNKGTSFMAIEAATSLIKKNNIDPKTIDLVVVATATPDMKAASTAAFTASEIGATNAFSFDMDALDPAFAPGVSHFEPGGFSTRQVLDVIKSIEEPIVGADIVEYNPDRDINGMTAMVATKLFKEICGQMLENSRLS